MPTLNECRLNLYFRPTETLYPGDALAVSVGDAAVVAGESWNFLPPADGCMLIQRVTLTGELPLLTARGDGPNYAYSYGPAVFNPNIPVLMQPSRPNWPLTSFALDFGYEGRVDSIQLVGRVWSPAMGSVPEPATWFVAACVILLAFIWKGARRLRAEH